MGDGVSAGYHRLLISDRARTDAFRDAIRRAVKPGDVVADIGSGSGILSFFAAEAGARRVFAIERQHTADSIALLARHLGFSDRIEVIHAYSTSIELPERANVLVTEMLSHFALEEQLLSVVIDARARMLTDDAKIIPSGVSLIAAPVEMPDYYDEWIAWFSKPQYGFDLSPLRTFASNTVMGADIPTSAHLAAPQTIADIDLRTITDRVMRGHANFEAQRDGVLHGFSGWFRSTLFEDIVLTNEVAGATHWKQVFLPLDPPIAVTRGTAIELQLESDDGRAWRWRGRAGDAEPFDQTTWLASPPCILSEQ